MLNHLKILFHQGKQFIPDVVRAEVPGQFRGRPVISDVRIDGEEIAEICPTGAIGTNPVSIDLGKCIFCNECALRFPGKIRFTKDFRIASNVRERLIIKEGDETPVRVVGSKIRSEITKVLGRSLKLRQVSAGGDNSAEWELNACSNVQFDMGRFGVEFVASPRHADGIVITGPITKNMAAPLQMCYDAVPSPKIIVLAGTDAISGGLFLESPAIDRSFLLKYPADLFIPGNPPHPLTVINGLLDLTRNRR